MDDSPLISPNIKEYNQLHNLEDSLNTIINQILISLPNDPYSELTNFFSSKSSGNMQIITISLHKVVLAEFKQSLSLKLSISYKGKTTQLPDFVLTFNLKSYENIVLNQANMESFIKIFERYKCLKINFEEVSSFDKNLHSVYEELEKGDINVKQQARVLCSNLSMNVFTSSLLIKGKRLFEGIKEVYPESVMKNIPNLGFTIFKCGKQANSKVKFERFIIFVVNQHKLSSEEIYNLVNKLYTSTRKVLTSGKQGENGIKLNAEGSYNSPNDTINDSIKLIEDIIKDTGEGSKLGIGIECNANNYYNEQTKLYDMDGFKKPPDADQLIDYYLKFCTDHPLITFLEDPIADNDIEGWKKIITKFQAKPQVKISCKLLINESLSHLKQYNEFKEGEEELTPEAKQKLNEKVFIPMNISFRYSEVLTVSELEESIRFVNMNLRQNNVGFTLWDAAVENDGSYLIDFGVNFSFIKVGFGVSNIILHGLNIKSDRINKINRYMEIVKELY